MIGGAGSSVIQFNLIQPVGIKNYGFQCSICSSLIQFLQEPRNIGGGRESVYIFDFDPFLNGVEEIWEIQIGSTLSVPGLRSLSVST